MPVDRRTQILAAAARRIAQDGVRGLRVTDVADEAGVSPGLLYYHFTDRSGLLRATLQHINARTVAARPIPTDAATARAALELRLLEEIDDVDDVRDNSAAWNELRALAVFETGLQQPLTASTRAWIDEVAGAVAAVGPDPAPRRTAVLLTALVEGLSGRWLAGGVSLDEARALLSEAVDRLVPPPRPEDPS